MGFARGALRLGSNVTNGVTVLAQLVSVLLVAAPGPGTPSPRVKRLPRGITHTTAPWASLEVDQCAERVAKTGWKRGFRFVRTRPQKKGRRNPIFCHIPQAMSVSRGPTGIRYKGYTVFNCAMGLAMTRFETIVQEEARRAFGTKYARPVVGIAHRGTYNCRRLRRGSSTQSQHSFANALDIKSFRVRGFGTVGVKRHWSSTRKRHKRARRFLHAVSARLRREGVFSNVLDPTWNAAHHDHIHVDLAPRKRGRPSGALKTAKRMPPLTPGAPPRRRRQR
ncbi:MAG: hypothetical protein ACI9MR_003179 [Myxococcota bacterium]|jgi:hypothetical protein